MNDKQGGKKAAMPWKKVMILKETEKNCYGEKHGMR